MELEKDITYMQVTYSNNKVWRLQKNHHYINFDVECYFKDQIIQERPNLYIKRATPEMEEFMDLCIANGRFLEENIPNLIINQQANYEIY